jgi:hypothetical protein
LNETLLWILYCVSGLLAFAATYHARSGIILGVLAGGLLTGAGWAFLYHFTDEEKRPQWIRVDLSLNMTFGLMFAAAGAILGQKLLARRTRED